MVCANPGRTIRNAQLSRRSSNFVGMGTAVRLCVHRVIDPSDSESRNLTRIEERAMRMRKFEFLSPSSLAETVALLEQHKAHAKLIAGGTDLLVQMKQKLIMPALIINLLEVPELKVVERNNDVIRIGSVVKHAVLDSPPLLQGGWEVLASAVHRVGSPQIRNLGTIGGNLCNASPSADSAPALLVLEGEVNLVSHRGERRLPLESFFIEPGVTVLERDEVLKEIIIPKPPANSLSAYLKLGRRKSLDLALVSAAALLTLNPGTGICERARVALGSVSPTPIRAKQTEKILEGKQLDEEVIREAGERAQKECRPISDIRASIAYRKEMVRVLVERAIKQCLDLSVSRRLVQESDRR